MICWHPTPNVHYYSEIGDDGREYEFHWCDRCNCWLTPAEEQDLRQREDYDKVVTD